ncbi:uncharacterized protein [Dermacentor albipictus]|uniref:uncharacterized protein isoform X1 n=1 Tax=Dermacentor albipictus TaxID=60249 RepID=UPI0031FC536B
MSSTSTTLYPDAFLAHFSYPSTTSSCGKETAAAGGRSRESAPHPGHHHEPRSWDCREPTVQGPPLITYCNAASDTGHKNPGVPVCPPVFQEAQSPPPTEQPLPKRHSPPPAPSECSRRWYFPSTAAAIVMTACLLVALTYAIRTEDKAVDAEVAPLVNSSALDGGDDCPCRLATSTLGGHTVPSGRSRNNVVEVTTRDPVTVRHKRRVGRNGKPSTAHPPAHEVALQSTTSGNIGRIVSANPALYAVGDSSSKSLDLLTGGQISRWPRPRKGQNAVTLRSFLGPLDSLGLLSEYRASDGLLPLGFAGEEVVRQRGTSPEHGPLQTTRPNKDKAAVDASGTRGGPIIRGSRTQGHDNEDSVAEVMPSNTALPEEIESGGKDSIQGV